ncbi:MAG: hypothetical protein ACREBE_17975 [bacterium]
MSYRGGVMSSSRTTAVVPGAGTSGMLAARVLSDSFSDVVIVDRRPLDPHTALRDRRWPHR